ncbi:MAG: undecaprenyl-phosphate glucose phosphotransferase, partial [Flavobacterium sp.]
MKILQKLSHYRFSRYFKLLFVGVDVVLLNLATILSALARFGSLDMLLSKEEKTVSLLAILIWIALLLQNDSNRSIRVEPVESILVRTIKKLIIHAALI